MPAPRRQANIPARLRRGNAAMRPAAILAARLGAWAVLLPCLASPGTTAAQAAEGRDALAAWRCEREAGWLTRCGMEVAAPGGVWEITARVWLRRASTAAPLAGEVLIRVDGLACGPPAGVLLPAAAGGEGLANHTLLVRCGVALPPGPHRVEALAGFGNPVTGADRVEVGIARWAAP